MPSFEILEQVELFLRKGKYLPGVTDSVKRTIRRTSKFYVYKDGCLLRKHRGRFLRAITSPDQIQEIMMQYHDNNNHAGRLQMIQAIMSVYYWGHLRHFVKEWIQKCRVCKARRETSEVRACLAYGCDASSFLHPDLTFHRFPMPREQRQQWLVVAQRDEGSIRKNSWLCSRHFEPDCFLQTEDGEEVLRLDAVPTIIGVSKQQAESQPADPEEPLFHPSSLEDLLTCAAATAEVCPVGFSEEQSDPPLDEHQYSLRVPDPHPPDTTGLFLKSRKNTSFTTYNHIVRYLTHRTLPESTKPTKAALRRMSKRFTLVDGVLMYKLNSRLVRVPRSREEVNSILQQFHDNRGHYGHRICFRAMSKHYYWASMSKDLHHWISRCSTCPTRTKRKWLRCSITDCTNCCGPVERKLGLTFHKFPMNRPAVLEQWLKATGRPHWYPPLWSSVCSVHFTEDCFDRSGGRVELRPDAVPTVKTHGDEKIQRVNQGQAAAEPEDTEEQEETFFSKVDAVELYLSRQTYPPGLNYVEKNTFRRFCKSYLIKDGALCIYRSDRVVPVLRNRARVNEALKEYHDELNHLDEKKCLRLLNERCFWKTMRADIRKWISKCSVCRWKIRLKNQTKRDDGGKLPSSHPTAHSDPESEVDAWNENDAFSDGSYAESESERATAIQPKSQKKVQVQAEAAVQKRVQAKVRTPRQTPSRTQVKDRLKTQQQPLLKVLSQSPAKTKVIILTLNRPPGAPVTQTSSPEPALCPDTPQQTNQNSKEALKQKAEMTEVQIENPNELNFQHEEQVETSLSKHLVQQIQKEEIRTAAAPQTSNKTQEKETTPRPIILLRHSSWGRPLKRKVFPDEESPTKGARTPVPEPTQDLGSKLRPVITVDDSPAQTEPLREKTDSAPPLASVRPLEARVVVQQCSRAKVKTRVGLDGVEPQYAQIGEGLVVYLCFFEGATEDTARRIADAVMNTQFFLDSQRPASVLELPGGVLLLPQESLGWERGPHRSMRNRGVIEAWRGSQLFSSLASHCREMLLQKGVTGGAVEQGVYGQKQEIDMDSSEPMSHILEF